jgi:hypothetical protein
MEQLDSVRTLVCGKAYAAPEKVEKDVTVASEDRSESAGLLFKGAKAFQFFLTATAAVIEEDGWKWSRALRTPEQRMKDDCAIRDFDGFWLTSNLRSCGGREKYRECQQCEERGWSYHQSTSCNCLKPSNWIPAQFRRDSRKPKNRIYDTSDGEAPTQYESSSGR